MVIQFGSDQVKIEEQAEGLPCIEIPLPVLGGDQSESVPPFSVGEATELEHFTIWKSEELVFGIAALPIDAAKVERSSHDLYRELFGLLDGRRLYRIWNYAPNINVGEGDAEIYKLFCKGRSEAFHEYFGDDDEVSMPSGSCLGADGDQLIVVFLAGEVEPSHHENPLQIPAYRYPRRYGPKSPSFARGTSVSLEDAFYRFISGTAAVIGCESVGIGDLKRQLEVTCDNLEIVEEQSKVALPNDTTDEVRVCGKVYLRNGDDYAETREYLEQRMPEWSKHLVYLRGDVCRHDLLVEIELNFKNPYAS